ncbi:hypothetical protein GDO78_013625, partial [Eleutherodactylus coqui]
GITKSLSLLPGMLSAAVNECSPHMQDVPYLDLAPYMPEYYKPQYLLDFEDRLPSNVRGSDSLSLNSFNSINSTNLEWDDSAIAPSSEDYDFGDTYPAVASVPSTDWEGGNQPSFCILPLLLPRVVISSCSLFFLLALCSPTCV